MRREESFLRNSIAPKCYRVSPGKGVTESRWRGVLGDLEGK